RPSLVDLSQELERIAESLPSNPHPVVVGRGRAGLDLIASFAESAKAGFDQVRYHRQRGHRGGAGATTARRAQEAAEAADEELVPARVERSQHRCPSLVALRL